MLKSSFKYLLARCGYDLQRYRRLPLQHTFLKAWKSLGLAPKFIVDIGANHGEWSRITSSYFPTAEYLLIEPQERLKVHSQDLLARSNIRWKTAGAGDRIDRMTLTVADRDDGATFLPVQSNPAQPPALQVEVDVTTLDQIVRETGRVPDIVKIDAEGFDMKVLRGGASVLGKTDLFFIECGVGETNMENTLTAVCVFMDAAGYAPIDITELNRYHWSQALMLCDVVFLRKASPLWAALKTSAPGASAH